MKRLLLIFLLVIAGLKLHAQKLHVIFASDKEDFNYGMVSLKDEERMTKLVKTLAWGLDYKIQITYLSKDKLTSVALKRTIDTLKTKPDDIIFLYYSGLGFPATNSQSGFPNLQLKDHKKKTLSLDEIGKWLNAKQVRLRFAIAECRSQSTTTDESRRPRASTTATTDLRKSVIQKLSLNTCGLIKIGSSMPFQQSWINTQFEGSVFTLAFYNAFEQMMIGTDSSSLKVVSFKQLKDLTAWQTPKLLYNKPFVQNSIWEITSCNNPAENMVYKPDSLKNTANTETLSGYLTAIAQTKEPTLKAQLKKDFMACFQNNATVQVHRFYHYEFADSTTYPLKTYLEFIGKPRTTQKRPGFVYQAADIAVEKIQAGSIKKTPDFNFIKHLGISELWF
jgi:hypothetical protein